MTAVAAFRSYLAAQGEAVGLRLSRWNGGTRKSDHLLELSTASKPTVLYVKESHSARRFWGLTKNQLDRLRASPVRWFVVLLDGGTNSGWLLSSSEVDARIADGSFELSRDGDHKVNESDLSSSQRFDGVAQVLGRVA